MGIRVLAEAIILQSLEDLWNAHHSRESAGFFGGEGFRIAAEIAGMGFAERLRLLGLVKELLSSESGAST